MEFGAETVWDVFPRVPQNSRCKAMVYWMSLNIRKPSQLRSLMSLFECTQDDIDVTVSHACEQCAWQLGVSAFLNWKAQPHSSPARWASIRNQRHLFEGIAGYEDIERQLGL